MFAVTLWRYASDERIFSRKLEKSTLDVRKIGLLLDWAPNQKDAGNE